VRRREVSSCVNRLGSVILRLRYGQWWFLLSSGGARVSGSMISHLARWGTRIAKRWTAYECSAIAAANVFRHRHCWILGPCGDIWIWFEAGSMTMGNGDV
jgi:hypothetical protein